MQRVDHPGYLLCPVTLSIFNEPVTVMPSGITYEWETIKEVISLARAAGKKPLCPKTREPIYGYVKAFQIDEAVSKYLQDHPDAKSDQYVKQHPHKHPPSKFVQLRRVKAPVAQPPRQPETEISPDDLLAIEAAQADLNALPHEQDVAGQIERIHQEDMERLHAGLYRQFQRFNQRHASEQRQERKGHHRKIIR